MFTRTKSGRRPRGILGRLKELLKSSLGGMKQQSQDSGCSKEEKGLLIDHRNDNGFHWDLGTQEKDNLGEEMLEQVFLVWGFLFENEVPG